MVIGQNGPYLLAVRAFLGVHLDPPEECYKLVLLLTDMLDLRTQNITFHHIGLNCDVQFLWHIHNQLLLVSCDRRLSSVWHEHSSPLTPPGSQPQKLGHCLPGTATEIGSKPVVWVIKTQNLDEFYESNTMKSKDMHTLPETGVWFQRHHYFWILPLWCSPGSAHAPAHRPPVEHPHPAASAGSAGDGSLLWGRTACGSSDMTPGSAGTVSGARVEVREGITLKEDYHTVTCSLSTVFWIV